MAIFNNNFAKSIFDEVNDKLNDSFSRFGMTMPATNYYAGAVADRISERQNDMFERMGMGRPVVSPIGVNNVQSNHSIQNNHSYPSSNNRSHVDDYTNAYYRIADYVNNHDLNSAVHCYLDFMYDHPEYVHSYHLFFTDFLNYLEINDYTVKVARNNRSNALEIRIVDLRNHEVVMVQPIFY